jgi:hypothetical protein
MKLQLEYNVIVPLGVCKKFMSKWNDITTEEECTDDGEVELPIEIKYPPIDYSGDIYWNEMSYHRLKDKSTDYCYDLYSSNNW